MVYYSLEIVVSSLSFFSRREGRVKSVARENRGNGCCLPRSVPRLAILIGRKEGRKSEAADRGVRVRGAIMKKRSREEEGEGEGEGKKNKSERAGASLRRFFVTR